MCKNEYLPEMSAPLFPQGQPMEVLQEALTEERILTGIAVRCDERRDLIVRLGGYEGRIPREEAVHPSITGAQREISILSRVGRPVSFVICSISMDSTGKLRLLLSRKKAQEKAIAYFLENAHPGQILPAQVTHLSSFGTFVDLGCGVLSMLPLEDTSTSRIYHGGDRFRVGQRILTILRSADPEKKRFYLSHKELLGTWAQNAADFSPGEVVPGIIRGIREYGVFVELAPNLSGLSDPVAEELAIGDRVSVYIKAVKPDKRKIKLQIIDRLEPLREPEPLRYFITEGTVENWEY